MDFKESTISLLTFPQRVHCMLNLVDRNHQEHIVSWVNEGTAFKVHDFKEFERHLLPTYFSATKYTSFTRALHAHGFQCERSGRQTGVYSHPWFNRNETEMLSLIKRTKPKKNHHATAAITDRRISASSASSTTSSSSSSSWISNNSLHTPRHRMTRQRPSHLDNMIASNNLAQVGLVGDRTIKSLSTLQEEVFPSRIEESSNSESVELTNSTRMPFVSPSLHAGLSSSTTNDGQQQTDDDGALMSSAPRNHHCSILDDQVAPIGLMSSNYVAEDQKQSAEILRDTHHPHSSSSSKREKEEEEQVGLLDFYNYMSSSMTSELEPRSIQAMQKSPSDLDRYGRL